MRPPSNKLHNYNYLPTVTVNIDQSAVVAASFRSSFK